MTPSAARPQVPGGLRAWILGLGTLVALLGAPFLLLFTPAARLAEAWWFLLLMGSAGLLLTALIGAGARLSLPALQLAERGLRGWVARFSGNPEALWLHWSRQAHHAGQARWCLERAVRLGGAEALFQEGLAFLEGGMGTGGQIVGVSKVRRAAELGHPEAAFRLAEALRTGQGGPVDARTAEAWYQRSARAGFGPAAGWLARAYEVGDGVTADGALARTWALAADRLTPHPPLTRSPLRHDSGPEDPLARFSGQAAAGVEEAADQVLAHRAGLWLLFAGAGLLALLFLLVAGTFLPLLMLVPPLGLLGWMAWGHRREGPARGRDPLREAAEAGDVEACFRLGQVYHRGSRDLPRDDLSSVLWLRKAAQGGHREAMRVLAEAYRGGHGVIRDREEAARWERAAGEPDA
jgi:TPR repeat protein